MDSEIEAALAVNGTGPAAANGSQNGGVAIDTDGMKMPAPVDSAGGDSADSRIKKKATRRLIRHGSREGNNAAMLLPGQTSAFVAPHRRWKNCRRSRNGNGGRGLPKKKGAGGKGVWGVPGDEIFAEEFEDDKNDPNYDESEVIDKNTEFKEVIPVLSPVEFVRRAEPILLEYYENGDTLEAARCFDEEVGPRHNLRPLIVSVALETAFDHKHHHCEMTSVLISDLYGKVVTSQEIAAGFIMVLQNLPDLILDTPEAPHILGNFIGRAIADDCIPPRFATHPDMEEVNEFALAALKRAETLLTMKKGLAHLDNVWGFGGPLRPVQVITEGMTMLLREYLSSRDLKEAHRCLLELEVPHFYHELVYEAVVMAIEAISQGTEEAMADLLTSLYNACMVSPEQMEQGFQRVFDDMTDIVLDVPLAYIMLDRIVERCSRAGILSDKTIRSMPSRGRKRFVSEGDGGHVKPPQALIRD